MSRSPLLFTLEDSIARLVLNRPGAANAINLELAKALVDAASRCETDGAIRCVVLTGTGRLFCAGGDIELIASAGDRAAGLIKELAGTLHIALSKLARMKKPLLVLVNGPAAGAGLSVALIGDVVLAARSAHFTAGYSAIGLTPDGGLTWLLPRFIGLRKAQEMILTNRRMSATEAEAAGLITRAVDDVDLNKEGHAVANALSRSATEAVGASRALLLESYLVSLEAQMKAELGLISAASAGQEGQEGIKAFVEKRKPNFWGA